MLDTDEELSMLDTYSNRWDLVLVASRKREAFQKLAI